MKKELPWLVFPGGKMKTTLFYGPWQCRQQFMNGCQAECAQHGYRLMGCMWLADIKLDCEGKIPVLPFSVSAGSRYGIYHCCCNYPTRSISENEIERRKWERFRDGFRSDWSERFGEWPFDNGRSWPGHHIRDLKHGGDPVDPNNIFPAQPDFHGVLNEQYPACCEGQSPWNEVGIDMPYVDN